MKRYSYEKQEAIEIPYRNLLSLDDRQANLFEVRSALLAELTNEFRSINNDDDLLEMCRSVYDGIAPQRCKPDPSTDNFENPKMISAYFDSISIVEKLQICKLLFIDSKISKKLVQTLLRSAEGEQPNDHFESSHGCIAYMKNNYTESAFLRFSKVIHNAKSINFHSFEAVCEEVYSGKCEFCILPLESSTEGRLNTFYSMIDRFELKINATCVIYHNDNQKFTKFALLKKSIAEFNKNKSSQKGQVFEFKIPAKIDALSPIGDILRCAEICNMKLIRIDSIPLPYNDEMLSYYASFNIDDSDFIVFLAYIMLEFPQCDPLGVYFTMN